jgi:hypothetical protein
MMNIYDSRYKRKSLSSVQQTDERPSLKIAFILQQTQNPYKSRVIQLYYILPPI